MVSKATDAAEISHIPGDPNKVLPFDKASNSSLCCMAFIFKILKVYL